MFEAILALPPLVIIVFAALVVSVISVLAHKFMTDQHKLKSIQEQQKKLREEMKKYKDNPEKVMKLQQRAMQINMEIFPQTMRSMVVTIIPLLLIFNLLANTVAYEPIAPGEVFSTIVNFETDAPGDIELEAGNGIELLSPGLQEITGMSVNWELKAEEGLHELYYTYGEESYIQEVFVGETKTPAQSKLEKQRKLLFIIPIGDGIPGESNIKNIDVEREKIRPLGNLSIFGWHPGWLAIYMISSLIFSMALRKLLKVY
ncbi:DUF106 domain-containing protein [Candidatus Woesearchaeota archaeon]|nr:DUF106 domain-containing protein [Candidatus Woesearchaeota archaeon]